jgi:glycosyltransferase involved in cell wall biosynthesis
VLVEGQPTLWFKGVAEALESVRAMTEPAHVTLACLDPEDAGEIDVDRVVGGLDPPAMAALYAETDVVLKLSRVEGLGLAPLEAFHVGVPCVVTPYTGHEAYLRHGDNGLVTGFDDVPGTARMLDVLARDRSLLARLGAGALRTAAGWPDPDASARMLVGALRELAEQPAPAAGLDQLYAALDATAALERRRLADAERGAGALAEARAHVEELSRSRAECAELLEDARRRLEEVTASRAYRAALAARRLVRRPR